MRRAPCHRWLSVLVLAGCASSGQPLHAQAPAEATLVRIVPEPILETLRRDKWKGEPSGAALSHRVLDEDVLELTRDKGWLYTPRNYYDFRLEYDMRVGPRGRHRVFFRTLRWPEQSYELRFDGRGEGVKGEVIANRWDLRRSSVPIPQDLLNAATATADWHRVELQCQGDRAAILINGQPVLRVSGLDSMGGAVGFAGRDVAYRKPRLIAAPTGPAIFRTAYVSRDEEPIEMPTVVTEVRPRMPEGAIVGREYVVVIEAVIDEAGDVAAARFLRRLDDTIGYNDEAMRVVRQWKFTPARLRGKPIPLLVNIEIAFTWK